MAPLKRMRPSPPNTTGKKRKKPPRESGPAQHRCWRQMEAPASGTRSYGHEPDQTVATGVPALKLGERARPHFFGEPAIATNGGYDVSIRFAGVGGKEKFARIL